MQTEPVTKKSSFGIVTVLLILALLAAIGLGYWGYTLGNGVKATQAAYADLKAKHDSLSKDKDAVSASLETAKADLETAKAELESAKKDLEGEQAKLATAKEGLAGLQANVDKALQFMDVMVDYWVRDGDDVPDLIAAIGDDELTKKYAAYQADDNNFVDWAKYVFTTISDLLTAE